MKSKKMHYSILFTSLIHLLFIAYVAPAKEHATVTIRYGARQVFKGFGCNQVIHYDYLGNETHYVELLPALRDSINKILFKQCNFRYYRLWGDYNVCAINGQSGYGDERDDYCIHEQAPYFQAFYEDAKKYQDSLTMLFAPYHHQVTNTETWAKMHAKQISILNTTYQVPFDYTGIINEPDVNDRLVAKQVPELIKAFRRELDNLELQHVGITASDNSSADPKAREFIGAIINDPETIDALSHFATHSYNWSITDEMEELVKPYVLNGEKEYWQTEGEPGPAMPEYDENSEIASDVISKFLGDMNHLCNVWMFHRGMAGKDASWNGNNGWQLILYRLEYDEIKVLLKCYYLKQASRTFNPGTVMRKSIAHMNEISDKYWRREDTTMVFAYGERAPLYVAAGVNPDGSWGIGLTNNTGFSRTPYGIPRPKMDFKVTVTVEEFVDSGKIDFTVHRCNAVHGDASDPYIHPEGTVTMSNGVVTIDSLGQFDFITLRSSPDSTAIYGKQYRMNRVVSAGMLSAHYGLDKSIYIAIEVPSSAAKTGVPVALTLYNAKGALVKNLLKNDLPPGHHKLTWQYTNNAPGAYLLKAYIGDLQETEYIIIP